MKFKSSLLYPAAIAMAFLLTASPALAQGIDQAINNALTPIADFMVSIVFFKFYVAGVGIPVVVLWLVLGALFCTFYLEFINVRGFKHALKLIRGDYHDDDGGKGEISHFNALCTAVSGTVGIGNIAGIPIAIAAGGPGAVFWMMVAGFLGMSTKFVECTLAVLFRKEATDGTVSGGPMYYLTQGLAKLGKPRLGKCLGGFYAFGILVGCLGIGNMFQSNQAYSQFLVVTGGDASFFADKGWLFGLLFAMVVFFVIVGGIRSISKVASKLVPFMAILYILTALVIIVLNGKYIPAAVSLIVENAFNGKAVGGGILGAIVIGFQRAIFSNEAGLGSAAIAHSAVQTKEPVTEGFVAILEPTLDTLIVLAITSLVITSSMVADPVFGANLMGGKLTGMAASSAAFTAHFPFSKYLLAAAGMLFALSTALAWSYYGLNGWTYLFGDNKKGKLFYNFMFSACFALGASIKLGALMDISDALVFLTCVPNVFGLFLLAPLVKAELNLYWEKIRTGQIPSRVAPEPVSSK
ncbi:MAG: alanine:cation symporter family protein [Desulfobacterales bacterium]|nr:alanine:cation symporter family protein [Desulfobacterales bacterium]